MLFICMVNRAPALSIRSGAIENRALFGVEFTGDSRSFYAKESSVLSISKQDYITTGFAVLEINITTSGNALLRIYHSRALTPGEFQSALADGVDAAVGTRSSIIRSPLPSSIEPILNRPAAVAEVMTSNTVVKDYPLTTHAKTIEYRVSKRSELIAFYDALEQHWKQEPAFFEDGQIVDEAGGTDSEMKPRSLGGTLFEVQD
ncbi:MAG: hypothetical protein ACI81V_000431 [Lentimonas sp.]|jgi:hypothetical protein